MLILTPASFSLTSAAGPGAAVDWATSANGQQLNDQGTGSVSALPAHDEVVFVLPPQAVSWHQITLPKVPASRLRAALDGMLEERVLNDTAELHFALAPGAKAGSAVWVAASHKAWVKGWVQALEAAGRPVTRIVPGWSPLMPTPGSPAAEPALLHWAHLQAGQPWLASATATGIGCIPLTPQSGAALASLLGQANEGSAVRWCAEPAAAALAEQCLDQRFELLTVPSWLLRCAQSDWNLAQFDLSLSTAARRGQRLRQRWRQWRSAPAWRAARWGLGMLVVVQILGLNAAAWQERNAIQTKQQALGHILKSSFPNVSLVLDAPVQMQRELSRMRQSSGQLSTSDLEAMLAGIAQASADNPVALSSIRYTGQVTGAEGRFSSADNGSSPWPALVDALQRAGWQATTDGITLTLRPGQP